MKKCLLALALSLFLYNPASTQQRMSVGTLCTAAQVSYCIFANSEKSLFGFAVNTTGSSVWVFLLDTNVAPVNGTPVIVRAYQPATTGTLGVSWSPDSLLFTNGITLACSSSAPPTLTLSPTCFFTAEVR